jgi:hypothetical protein
MGVRISKRKAEQSLGRWQPSEPQEWGWCFFLQVVVYSTGVWDLLWNESAASRPMEIIAKGY